jgi:hypothetical protein
VLTIFGCDGCAAAAGAFDGEGAGLECHVRLRRSEVMQKVDDLGKETLGGRACLRLKKSFYETFSSKTLAM